MIGDLYINGQDAYQQWGVNIGDKGLTALMTPAPLKERITNNSRLEHGKRILNNAPRFDSREVTLDMHLIATNTTDFLNKYQAFCDDVLASGQLTIETKYQSGVVYKMLYVSCTQYSAILNGIAKFTLKLIEPNTKDRR